jgi:hypothetical protein
VSTLALHGPQALREAEVARGDLARLHPHGPGVLRVSGADGTTAEVSVPAEVVDLLADVLGQLARGLGVRVVAEEQGDDARRAALDELTALSDELGLYD